ncbi:YaeQ family protein [Bowmanella denitrificans]|uniref:YaeQ family protein n=1 Tax=Bowmanella denitrificans TaxID=366582 RepID=A0ABP3HFD3_9ALTE
MALKPTIFKFIISLSDLDRDYYDTLHLTVAQHPSESLERMMARVLAYCLNAREGLVFTTGLSTPNEPDIWQRGLDDQLLSWIDVGEPAFERIKKASRQAREVKIYSFNQKSEVWWQQEQAQFKRLPVKVARFPWPAIQQLASLVERSMVCSLSISDATLYMAAKLGEAEIPCIELQG